MKVNLLSEECMKVNLLSEGVFHPETDVGHRF
jgi:hypothetical protein